MSEISRNIFNAVDMLVDKKLSNYKADLTASYVICDNSRAAEGIYTVSNNKDKGTVSFIVYKQTTDNYTYKIGDSVYILIPGGDYKEKKFIMGLENEIKDRIVPEQKEVPTHFISLGDSYTPEIGELPVTLILNSDTKSYQISQKELPVPRVLVNYKKIRISATFNVNLDTKMAVDLNSSSYAIKFIAHDSSNDRDFIYTLSSNDILSNLYYFGNEYYTFTKDIDIDTENFSISKYTLLLEQAGILKDLKGESNNIKGKIILKNINVSFGCLSSEYQDEIFAYTENNIKTFTDNINLSIGVKINKDEKEVNTLKDFFGTNKDGLIYWEQLINGVWYPYKSDIKNFITSIDITNDIVNLTLRSYIGIRIENKIEVWNGKYSNSLSLDNSLKTQYNYNIRIFSEHGNLLRKTDTTTLTVKLYQNNKEIELGENKYNFTISENIIKELKYYWYKGNDVINDKNSFSLTVDGTDISAGNGTNYSCKLQIGQTNSEGTFQSQEEAYDTLTLRTYEEPKETALYEIVSDYEEIGVCYEKITTGETVSKGLQYFPDENINLKLYKFHGLSREQILSGKLYYGFSTTQLSNLTELSFASPDISLSIENIKFTNIENENGEVIESAEQQYSKFKDKDRYIYIVYKDDNEHILAEKWIYLVHATSSILANFETTAFGFNDLTQDGTKGIRFEAAGGMNFYAGDAKGQGAEKNIITIWSGNANGIEGNPTYHGEKVFYVTNEGNVELNSANIRGNLVSKEKSIYENLLGNWDTEKKNSELLGYNYETNYFNNWDRDGSVITYPRAFDSGISDLFSLLPYSKELLEDISVSITTMESFNLLVGDSSYTIALTVKIKNDNKEPVLYFIQELKPNMVINKKIKDFFSEINWNEKIKEDKRYNIEFNLTKTYDPNNLPDDLSEKNYWGCINKNDNSLIQKYSPFSYASSRPGKEKVEAVLKEFNLYGYLYSFSSYGTYIYTPLWARIISSDQASLSSIKNISELSFVKDKMRLVASAATTGIIISNSIENESTIKSNFLSSLEGEELWSSPSAFTSVVLDGIKTLTLPIRNTEEIMLNYKGRLPIPLTPGVSTSYPFEHLSESEKYDFVYSEENNPPFNWHLRYKDLYIYDEENKKYIKNTSSTWETTKIYYSRSKVHSFDNLYYSDSFYYIQNDWNKYISETETALYGTLHTPKIDFSTETSATGNISISGDRIQIIRGQIDSSGNISASDYIGNSYRDGFAKAPIQIKSYGTVVDDTYIPALSFQDVNDTSMNDSNENVQTFWTMGYRNNLKCFEILGIDIIGNEIEQGMGGIRIPKSMVDGRHLLNMDEFIYLKRKYCGGEVKLAAQSHQQFSTNPASLADEIVGLTPIAIAAEPSGDPGVIAHPNGWIHNSKNTEATIYGVFYYFLYVPSWLWYLEG